jgi:phage-related protein
MREFPEDARHDAGYQLEKVQRGEQPDDFKPMPAVGKGAEEIRMTDESGAYRVIYVARAPKRSTCCMLSRRRRARLRGTTSKLPERDSRKC